MSKDDLVKFGEGVSLFFIFFSSLLLLIFWNRLPPQVPFFYSRPWGEEQLGQPLFLWFFPLASLISLIVNHFLNRLLKTEILLIQIITFGLILFSFFCFFAQLRIIFLSL